MGRASCGFALAAYGITRPRSNRAGALWLAIASLFAAPAAAEMQHIVALGDSLTHGYGLPVEDGFVPQLERWLRDEGRDVAVANAGVSGDTTAGGRARLAWALGEGADGLIVTLGGNDLLRGIDPAASRANLDAILAEAGARGIPVLLVAMEAPGNYGPDYKRDFDGMYADLAARHGALLVDSFLAPLMSGVENPADLARYMQPDGLHPNAEGVARIVDGLGPRVIELLDRAAGG
jgi:acyl-CoA thioesterase-1